ncbi:MAG: YciI family protein [Owenweeksia sp.]
MKKLLCALLISSAYLVCGQTVEKDKEGFETFRYKEGDTTYVMKKYHIVFLRKGSSRKQDAEEAAEIQKEHLAHLSWLEEEGYLDIAGPFGDDGDIRGILIMHVPTLDKTEELVLMDPAVKAGRLEVEIHPWWAAEGSKLR